MTKLSRVALSYKRFCPDFTFPLGDLAAANFAKHVHDWTIAVGDLLSFASLAIYVFKASRIRTVL